MSIVYLKLEVSIHRLNLRTDEETNKYILRLKQLIEEYNPSDYQNITNKSVDIEIIEYAGNTNDQANRSNDEEIQSDRRGEKSTEDPVEDCLELNNNIIQTMIFLGD